MSHEELTVHYVKKIEIRVMSLPKARAVSFMLTDIDNHTIEITAFLNEEE
jgi:hypothetical protein